MKQSNSCGSHQRSILATWMRSGTSKGLYVLRDQLPKCPSAWEPILLSLMGTGSQTNGIGGGTPTTSKVAVVSRSTVPGYDVDYTFAQADFAGARLDMSGTCGNIAAGVGQFALDQNLVEVPSEEEWADIRVLVTNTGQALLVSIPLGNTKCDIRITFLDPNGNMTGKLFPSGARKDYLAFQCPSTGTKVAVRATLIDCTNPFILVDSASMPTLYALEGPKATQSEALIEAIRRAGAVRMGLAKDVTEAGKQRGTPKIAVIANPSTSSQSVDVDVTAFTAGVLHPTFQVTGAICLSAALSIPGTVASDLLPSSILCRETFHSKLQWPRIWRIAHRAGQVDVEVSVSQDTKGEYFVERGSIMRTARKLFEGRAFYTL
ncbi:DUF453-domain-containing protein [Penicillium coprophilum]|uniref:DUF453-domain-containing protein n=1 Tax=Penicillium coprophilum TaxID=36646 RepID=UPI00239A8471|nr:DUF453-domain-containing protein [Penicillium coprophilum]KAJ5154988.1 DUF453-domain-containing protein [Penicillium coprophilum]